MQELVRVAMAAGLGKKRKVDEWDVSDIEQCSSGTVHGIVTELSPASPPFLQRFLQLSSPYVAFVLPLSHQ